MSPLDRVAHGGCHRFHETARSRTHPRPTGEDDQQTRPSCLRCRSRPASGHEPRRRLYPIEIQLLNIPDLPARILYGWADLYSAQLQGGDGDDPLQPTYAIGLLGQALRPGDFGRPSACLRSNPRPPSAS